jgi:hypothetical protein
VYVQRFEAGEQLDGCLGSVGREGREAESVGRRKSCRDSGGGTD